MVKDSRCLFVVQCDPYLLGELPFAVVQTSTMGDFTYAEKADMYYIYRRVNGNERAALRMYHADFLTDECQILLKQVRSTSTEMKLVGE